MKNKLYSINVKGNEKEWSFQIIGRPEYLKDWEADGLDVSTIVNTIPDFVVWLGLTKLWCWLQDKGIIGL